MQWIELKSQQLLERGDRLARPQEVPFAHEPHAVEERHRPEEQGEEQQAEQCRRQHAPDILQWREALAAKGVDQVDQEQRRGGVLAQHRCRERDRRPPVVAQEQQEPQQRRCDHHDVVVAFGDRLRDAEWHPSEQRDGEAALARRLVALDGVDQEQRPEPCRRDQDLEQQPHRDRVVPREQGDQRRQHAPQRPVGHRHRKVVERQAGQVVAGEQCVERIDPRRDHAAPRRRQPEILREQREGDEARRRESDGPAQQQLCHAGIGVIAAARQHQDQEHRCHRGDGEWNALAQDHRLVAGEQVRRSDAEGVKEGSGARMLEPAPQHRRLDVRQQRQRQVNGDNDRAENVDPDAQR